MTTKAIWVPFVALAVSVSVAGGSSAAQSDDPIGQGTLTTGHPSHAKPTVLIDFDELTGKGNPVFGKIESKGFLFTSKHAHVMLNPKGCSFDGCASNGTPFVTEEDGGLGRPITMARADGGKFCLKRFDGAENFLNDEEARDGGYPNAARILVVGSTAKGLKVTQSFDLDGQKDGSGGVPDFQSFTFDPAFRGLISATFYGNDRDNTGAISVDNISVRS